jgi:hypothetical protein
LPASPKSLPRLTTLRADRSSCRPTGDPKPPGSGFAKTARGHRRLAPLSGSRLESALSTSEIAAVIAIAVVKSKTFEFRSMNQNGFARGVSIEGRALQ